MIMINDLYAKNMTCGEMLVSSWATYLKYEISFYQDGRCERSDVPDLVKELDSIINLLNKDNFCEPKQNCQRKFVEILPVQKMLSSKGIFNDALKRNFGYVCQKNNECVLYLYQKMKNGTIEEIGKIKKIIEETFFFLCAKESVCSRNSTTLCFQKVSKILTSLDQQKALITENPKFVGFDKRFCNVDILKKMVQTFEEKTVREMVNEMNALNEKKVLVGTCSRFNWEALDKKEFYDKVMVALISEYRINKRFIPLVFKKTEKDFLMPQEKKKSSIKKELLKVQELQEDLAYAIKLGLFKDKKERLNLEVINIDEMLGDVNKTESSFLTSSGLYDNPYSCVRNKENCHLYKKQSMEFERLEASEKGQVTLSYDRVKELYALRIKIIATTRKSSVVNLKELLILKKNFEKKIQLLEVSVHGIQGEAMKKKAPISTKLFERHLKENKKILKILEGIINNRNKDEKDPEISRFQSRRQLLFVSLNKIKVI
jgi:flagellar biosynthesis/type III secretory pathway chaperone